jgi:DNA-binding PucR family transcriptional regulator
VAARARGAIGGERGRSLEELRTVVEVALSRGRSGVVEVADYLSELLLQRSPRVAAQISARLYGRLEEAHPELARTLDLLVENGFERGRTAQALPVHRNTLRDRITRISEITHVDLNSPEGRGVAWLAWLGRRDAASTFPEDAGA